MKREDRQKKNKPFSDSELIWDDSWKLRYLICQYKGKLKEAQKEALNSFWAHARSINEKRPGVFQGKEGWWMSDEEMEVLKAAADGNLKSIQILVEKNPNILCLPFVLDKMIDILLEYKYAQERSKLENIRKDYWPRFLPKRTGGKNYISINDVKDLMTRWMETPVKDVICTLNSHNMDYILLYNKPNDDIVGLINQIKVRPKMTKELAGEVIRHFYPINEKTLKSIRVQEKVGRPKNF